MTGEITLRGKVLPVGGIKEKVLAAKEPNHIYTTLRNNKRHVEQIPKDYIKGLHFEYVKNNETGDRLCNSQRAKNSFQFAFDVILPLYHTESLWIRII